jgi:hypothetical protein
MELEKVGASIAKASGLRAAELSLRAAQEADKEKFLKRLKEQGGDWESAESKRFVEVEKRLVEAGAVADKAFPAGKPSLFENIAAQGTPQYEKRQKGQVRVQAQKTKIARDVREKLAPKSKK